MALSSGSRFAHLAQAQEDIGLQPLHFAVGDEEKVSRTACRVEHAKFAKIGKRFAQFADVFPATSIRSRHGLTIVGPTTFRMSNSLVKCPP